MAKNRFKNLVWVQAYFYYANINKFFQRLPNNWFYKYEVSG